MILYQCSNYSGQGGWSAAYCSRISDGNSTSPFLLCDFSLESFHGGSSCFRFPCFRDGDCRGRMCSGSGFPGRFICSGQLPGGLVDMFAYSLPVTVATTRGQSLKEVSVIGPGSIWMASSQSRYRIAILAMPDYVWSSTRPWNEGTRSSSLSNEATVTEILTVSLHLRMMMQNKVFITEEDIHSISAKIARRNS